MRITRNKAVAASAAAALTVTLTACGGGGTEGDGPTGGEIDMESQIGYMEDFEAGTTFQATEPLQFGLLYRDHPNYPFQDDWSILQHLEENQNVTFDFENVPLEDMQQRRSVLISSGEAPEIMPVTYPGDESQFVSGGALLPISDYVQYMPNFQQRVEEWDLQAEIDAQKQEDGKYYMIPGLHEVTIPGAYTVAIRQDLWDDAGLEHPATWDELADQLRVIKEENPELDYPMTDRWSINGPIEATLSAAAPNFGTVAGWGYGAGLQWNQDEGVYEYAGGSDEYRALVGYFADLVADGLLDPEALTQEDDQAEQKFASGQAAAIGANDQVVLEYRDAFEEIGDTTSEIELITVPGGPAGDYIAGGTRRESGLMFSAQAAESDHFLAMLQFVDWLYYSDEGLEFAKWGVEGETFEWDGDKRVLVEDVTWGSLNAGAPKLLNSDFGYYNGVWSLAHGSTEELDMSMRSDEAVEYINNMNAVKEELEIPPAVAYDEIEQEQAGLQQTTLQDMTFQATAQFILGDRSMDDWDTYVAELEGAGMQEYVDRANAAAGVTG
ncbi:ABC transporter substrate-binding protein [Myceligenerans salitolerans]|uniref:Extracellular solute-binding protein n=1 Tax=Myceligenerans salitolerans TaxID=1230528 RepID=A0ABS3I8K2_9MICO|nr:extracellular solute-binding protein [Myceligenerans salitolerans]MBO0609293.1 extracellular solute-binding protein [Myceligenerans salitolerans]